jgi:hypothetical protein
MSITIVLVNAAQCYECARMVGPLHLLSTNTSLPPLLPELWAMIMSYVVPSIPTTLWQRLVQYVYAKRWFERQLEVVMYLLPCVYTDDETLKEEDDQESTELMQLL